MGTLTKSVSNAKLSYLILHNPSYKVPRSEKRGPSTQCSGFWITGDAFQIALKDRVPDLCGKRIHRKRSCFPRHAWALTKKRSSVVSSWKRLRV